MSPALDPPLDSMSLKELVDLTTQTCVDPATRESLLSYERMPLEGLINLALINIEAFAKHPTVRLQAATDSNFFKTLHIRIVTALVEEGLLFSAGLLHLMATKIDSVELHKAIASSPKLNQEIAGELKNVGEVRRRLAQNPATPHPILPDLIDIGELDVLSAIAERTDLTKELFEMLRQDDRAQVLWRMSNNPNIPNEILEILTWDHRPGIRARALDRLGRGWSTEPLRQWAKREH